MQSINEIYEKQVRKGVEVTDLTMLNTMNGAMGQCMDMFLDHKVQENALGELTAAEKKEKRRQAGLARKAGGARISAGLMAITDGYAIGPDCLAWARRTRLEKERQTKEKEKAGRLERILLKQKVDLLLAKGATPVDGKWNNHDLKVMIQGYKRDGDKAMPKNKEGLLLRYRETHTRVVTTYPVDGACPVDGASPQASRSTEHPSQSTNDPKTFALAAAGNPAAAHAAPVVLPSAASGPDVAAPFSDVAVAQTPPAGTIVDTSALDDAVAKGANTNPSHSSTLDWDDDDVQFDVGLRLNKDEVAARPLCCGDESSSDDDDDDDDSILVDLTRW